MGKTEVQHFNAAAQASGRAVRFVRRLPRRATWIALAAAGIGGGLFLGWDGLAAAGLAPLVLGLLPCAVMCAAGLCAGPEKGQGGCHGGSVANSQPAATKMEIES